MLNEVILIHPRLTVAFFSLRIASELGILPLNAYREKLSLRFVSSLHNESAPKLIRYFAQLNFLPPQAIYLPIDKASHQVSVPSSLEKVVPFKVD